MPVFGVGHEGGVYYYVMQFIQGQPLDEVMAELRRLREGVDVAPRPGPAPRADADAGDVARSLWRANSGRVGAVGDRGGSGFARPTEPARAPARRPRPRSW